MSDSIYIAQPESDSLVEVQPENDYSNTDWETQYGQTQYGDDSQYQAGFLDVPDEGTYIAGYGEGVDFIPGGWFDPASAGPDPGLPEYWQDLVPGRSILDLFESDPGRYFTNMDLPTAIRDQLLVGRLRQSAIFSNPV